MCFFWGFFSLSLAIWALLFYYYSLNNLFLIFWHNPSVTVQRVPSLYGKSMTLSYQENVTLFECTINILGALNEERFYWKAHIKPIRIFPILLICALWFNFDSHVHSGPNQFDDIKEQIGSHNSKMDGQYNDRNKKKCKNDNQSFKTPSRNIKIGHLYLPTWFMACKFFTTRI